MKTKSEKSKVLRVSAAIPYLACVVLGASGVMSVAYWARPDLVPVTLLKQGTPTGGLLLIAAAVAVLFALLDRRRLIHQVEESDEEVINAFSQRDAAFRQAQQMRARAEGLALMREIHRCTAEPDREERLHRILTLVADLFDAREIVLFACQSHSGGSTRRVPQKPLPIPAAYLVSGHMEEFFISFREDIYSAAVYSATGGDLTVRLPGLRVHEPGQTCLDNVLHIESGLQLNGTPVGNVRRRMVLTAGQDALSRQAPADLIEPMLARLDFGPSAWLAADEALKHQRTLRRVEPKRNGMAEEDDRLVLSVPLIAEQVPVGVLRIRRSSDGYHGSSAEAMEEILVESSKHIALALKKEEDERRAITDVLTGLFVKRRFLEELDNHCLETDSGPADFCLAMIDIDHFKKVNDTHGHLSGDNVLRDVAGILRSGLRVGDTAFRYGGEEMALLLHTPSLDSAVKTADRLRTTIETATFRGEKGQVIPVTISVGVTRYSPGLPPDDLIARADRALYVSKDSGRNQVTSWTPAMEKTSEQKPAKKDNKPTEQVPVVA